MQEGKAKPQTPGRPVWFSWIGLFFSLFSMGNAVCHDKPATWLDTFCDMGSNAQGAAFGAERPYQWQPVHVP